MSDPPSREGSVVDSWGRLKNTVVVKPIVYGNTAKYFGKKRETDGHTHSWTIFVKPYLNDDMSKWVRKVTFKLHESYANSTRVLEKPPYEVTETGWGEFECVIKIFWFDSNERGVSFCHHLKLFQWNADPQILAGKKPVVSEYYDEIVFHEPSQFMHDRLMAAKPKTSSILKHETEIEHRKERSHQLIVAAKEQVREEIADLKEALKDAKKLIQKFSEDVAKASNAEGGEGEVKQKEETPEPMEEESSQTRVVFS